MARRHDFNETEVVYVDNLDKEFKEGKFYYTPAFEVRVKRLGYYVDYLDNDEEITIEEVKLSRLFPLTVRREDDEDWRVFDCSPLPELTAKLIEWFETELQENWFEKYKENL